MTYARSFRTDGVAVALIVVALLLTGCSVMVMPHAVPQVKGNETASLVGSVLMVENAEKDPSIHAILD